MQKLKENGRDGKVSNNKNLIRNERKCAVLNGHKSSCKLVKWFVPHGSLADTLFVININDY